MKPLFNRLATAGVDRPFVQRFILPEWWDDSVVDNPAGYAQALGLIARRLNLELPSLQDQREAVRLREVGPTKFKLSNTASEAKLLWAKNIALRAAQIAAHGMARPLSPLPARAADIRQQLLNQGAAWVSLESLLDYCWAAGIPVLHVAHFPKGAVKMDGLVAMVDGRPAIVVCRNNRYSAWLLFILAHELGHVGRGHLQEGGALVDEQIKTDNRDIEEQEANQYAVEVLTGNPNIRYAAPQWLSGKALAPAAMSAGQSTKVDPGVVALNYAWGEKQFAAAMTALKAIEPNANAPATIRQRMMQHLDWEKLSADNREFLQRITATED